MGTKLRALTIYVDPEWYRDVQSRAKQCGRPLSNFVARFLARYKPTEVQFDGGARPAAAAHVTPRPVAGAVTNGAAPPQPEEKFRFEPEQIQGMFERMMKAGKTREVAYAEAKKQPGGYAWEPIENLASSDEEEVDSGEDAV
jgi:hypothetical protein